MNLNHFKISKDFSIRRHIFSVFSYIFAFIKSNNIYYLTSQYTMLRVSNYMLYIELQLLLFHYEDIYLVRPAMRQITIQSLSNL